MAKNLILVDKGTGEVTNIISPFDDRSYQPQSYSGYVPYLLDDSLPPIVVSETVFTETGDQTTVRQISLPPVTEQRVTGTLHGSFNRGELLFQSTLHPTLVNNLSLGGRVAVEYNPVVVTGIGETPGTIVGQKCARFMGSYLDTDTKAACLRIPDYTFPGSCLPYFMVSGFVYMSSAPSSAYDPIIIAKTTSGTSASINDSFQLEYDNSATRMLLLLSSNSYASPGYEYTINASPAGVSLNQWHHFAFAYSNQGNSACVSTYWNGTRIAKQTGLSGNIRFNSAPFSVGGGPAGDKPFKGYFDDFIVSGGLCSDALRGFEHGVTSPVPTESQSSGAYTIWHSTFHGPESTSFFPVSGPSKVVSTHMYSNTNPTTATTNLYVGAIDANQDSVHGLGLFTGISAGHIAFTNGLSAGYVFGYDSGACLIPSSVDQLLDFATVKKTKSSLIDNTQSYLLGYAAMRGNTGGSGDFPKLYSGAYNAGPFTFLPTKQNIEDLRTLYDSIILSGQSVGTYNIFSADGISCSFSVNAVTSLYSDVTNYYSKAYQDSAAIKSSVVGSSSFSVLRQIDGLSRASFVQKLSERVGSDAPAFTISSVSKTTKKYVTPEYLLVINAKGILPVDEFGGGSK